MEQNQILAIRRKQALASRIPTLTTDRPALFRTERFVLLATRGESQQIKVLGTLFDMSEKAPFRVLALDGGGAKGFYTIGVLKEVEALVGRP